MRYIRIRRLVLIAAGVSLLIAAAANAAPHFARASSDVANNGALVVSFDERGLGNGNIDYAVSYHVSATFACINGGGKNPSAANKRTIESDDTATGSFESKNGRVVASITSDAPSAGDFTCPSGQRLTFLSVSYTDITITDTTSGVSTDVPDASGP